MTLVVCSTFAIGILIQAGINRKNFMKAIRILTVIAICALVSSQVWAGVVSSAADWNFDANAANNNNTAAFTYSGKGKSFTGYSANNRIASVFSSASLSGLNPSSSSSISPGTGNGGGTTLQFSGGGNDPSGNFVLTLTVANTVSSISQITVRYNYFATSASGTALNTWSLSGVTGTQPQTIIQNGTWNSAQVTFSGLSLGGGSSFTLTDVLSGYTSGGSGLAEFDNISFEVSGPSLVPEPIAYALPLFGLIFIGGTAGRFWLGRQKAEGKV